MKNNVLMLVTVSLISVFVLFSLIVMNNQLSESKGSSELVEVMQELVSEPSSVELASKALPLVSMGLPLVSDNQIVGGASPTPAEALK